MTRHRVALLALLLAGGAAPSAAAERSAPALGAGERAAVGTGQDPPWRRLGRRSSPSSGGSRGLRGAGAGRGGRPERVELKPLDPARRSPRLSRERVEALTEWLTVELRLTPDQTAELRGLLGVARLPEGAARKRAQKAGTPQASGTPLAPSLRAPASGRLGSRPSTPGAQAAPLRPPVTKRPPETGTLGKGLPARGPVAKGPAARGLGSSDAGQRPVPAKGPGTAGARPRAAGRDALRGAAPAKARPPSLADLRVTTLEAISRRLTLTQLGRFKALLGPQGLERIRLAAAERQASGGRGAAGDLFGEGGGLGDEGLFGGVEERDDLDLDLDLDDPDGGPRGRAGRGRRR